MTWPAAAAGGRIRNQAGEPLDPSVAVGEGDRLSLLGDFAELGDDFVLMFGDVPTEVVQYDETELDFVLRAVPTGGQKCPVFVLGSGQKTLDLQDTPGAEVDVLGTALAVRPDLAPEARSPGQKLILFNDWMQPDADAFGYTNPCVMAARAYYCTGAAGDWMPALNPQVRVFKTVWRSQDELPDAAIPSHYYSYDGPGGRHYLVGIHMGVSTGLEPGEQGTSYFEWASFWVPKPDGSTVQKNGEPLAYNDACTLGSGADRPQGLNPDFARYVMCTDSADGEELCGNPWIPGECDPEGCAVCHKRVGKVQVNDTGYANFDVGWLPSFASDDIVACYDLIKLWNEEKGNPIFRGAVPQSCLP